MPGQTLAWLTQNTSQRRLTIFTAHLGEDLAGLATTIALAASLQLSCCWQLRDLYVVRGERRCGAGRALLNAVRETAVGATRVSVQTEPATLRRSSSTAPAASSRWRASKS